MARLPLCCCLLVFLIMRAGMASAEVLADEAALRAFSDKVMQQVAKGEHAKALELLKPYSLQPAEEFKSTADASQASRAQHAQRYGKPVGYAFVSQRKVADSVLRLLYMEKTERHALPWAFIFYKTPKGWMLSSFGWNDRLPQFFDLN
ncbi:MAG: hypothetical protein SF172_00420 [Burkholderiales bacterium]|nr:hypothetical protein [Burkholderiales bacterium]